MKTYTKEEVVRTCMWACHRANEEVRVMLGEPNVIAREDLPQVIEKVLSSPPVGSRESHKRWCDNMRAKGWVYGEVQDEEKKIHPNLVEWEKLSPEQKLKDMLFVRITNAFRDYLKMIESA